MTVFKITLSFDNSLEGLTDSLKAFIPTANDYYSKRIQIKGFPGNAVIKNPLANTGDSKRHRFDPWVRKIPWSRK